MTGYNKPTTLADGDSTYAAQAMKFNWPGESVLNRLIETVEKGIGGALRPWQIRRIEGANTDARIRERLLLEHLELNIADLRAGRKVIDSSGTLIQIEGNEPFLLDGPSAESSSAEAEKLNPFERLTEDARAAEESERLGRIVNLKRITLVAEEEAEEMDRAANEHSDGTNEVGRVEGDWLHKWRKGAEDVSREEMQRLWARMLAGEVRRPGTYSLRTIDFLSQMNSADASLISRVGPFATGSGIVKVGEDFFARKGLTFGDFLKLEEMGILNGVAGALGLQNKLGITHLEGLSYSDLICNGTALVFDLRDAELRLSFDVFRITQVGSELLSLAKFGADAEYLQEVAKIAVQRGAAQVSLGVLLPDGQTIRKLGLFPVGSSEAVI